MAEGIHVSSIVVPRELVLNSKGVSIDIGGSLIKVVYRTREQYEKVLKEEGCPYGELHVALLSNREPDKALQFIKDNAYLRDTGDIVMTGWGGGSFTQSLHDCLGQKCQCVMEFTLLATALPYMTKHVAGSVFLKAEIPEFKRNYLQKAQLIMEYMLPYTTNNPQMHFNNEIYVQLQEHLKSQLDTTHAKDVLDTRPLAETEDIFPCFLVTCGSGVSFLKIEADGTFYLADILRFGGISFLGVGSVLLGCKSYNDLVALAEKGNPRAIDLYIDDVKLSGAYYSSDQDTGCLLYNWAKAVGRSLDEFKPEDLALSWLNAFVLLLASATHKAAQAAKVSKVFFAGGFTQSDFVCSRVTEALSQKNYSMETICAEEFATPIQAYFIKEGVFLSALGGLIKTLEK